jgi:hypothetical protein
MDILDWPSSQEPSGSTPTTANLDPVSQPSAMEKGHVEVDQLPQAWEYDFDLDFEHLPSQIPTSKLALMRQRRRRQQQYRRRGPSRPEPRLHRQGRPDRSHNATSMLSQLSHTFPPRPTDLDMEVLRQPEHGHRHQQLGPGEGVGLEPACPSSPPVLHPGATIEPDLVMSNGTSCGGSAQDRDKEMNLTPQDGPPPTLHGDLVPENNAAQSSNMGTLSRPPLRHSTLRSESIRAALALEALSLNNESSDCPQTAPTTPSAPDSGDDQDLLDSLSLHREYGLLRVRSSSASAAPTGNKVLVHSVPRVRKRRLKKVDARLGTGGGASARGTTPLSEQHPSPPAVPA